jgi:transcriptional regulator with XRE-family HTH domain
VREDAILAVFGRTVRALRKALGWSQERLAFESDLHFTYISSIERGERNIGLIAVVRLARALHVPVTQLVEALDAKPAKGRRRIAD